MRTEARFPGVPAKAGHYESFYIKAARPSGGQAVWIRHTIHKRPGADPTASLWFTWFDAEAEGPRATKQTLGADSLSAPDGAYVRVADATLAPGRAAGAAASEALAASWDLEFSDPSEPLRHLPYELMYRAKLPRTKLLSPYPNATFTGSIEVGGDRFELDSWPGMVGHNWGAEHAERWVWLQASNLGGAEGDYLDLAAGRIRVAGIRTPWVANGRIVLDGTAYRLGGLRDSYGTEIDARTDGCEFTLPGKGINVKGRVRAPRKDFVAWVYADPDGSEHQTINCSISDVELKVERAGERHAHLEVAGAAAYERGGPEADHGVPVQPYPDG